LSDDFQSSPGVLNEGSELVSTIGCLEDDGYTPVGPTMEAAVDELLANGRPDVTWGIILFGDGVANRPIGGDTDWKSPAADASAPGGDNNGFETNSPYAYADGGSYAQDTNSGTNNSTDCGDSGKDRHVFHNYGVSVPGTNDVTGIQVRLDARVDSTSGASVRRMCVELSWDGGVNWTAAKQTSNLGTSFQTFTLGGSADNWGHSWTPTELSNANFQVRITNVSNKSSPYDRDFRLDWAPVSSTHGRAPAANAGDQADRAKARDRVFTTGYGLRSGQPRRNYCNDDDTGGWESPAGAPGVHGHGCDHFFDSPARQT
jgi:hypothetical protein